MLDFELIKNDGRLIEYRYFPEGKLDSGTIVMSVSGELISIEKALNDKHKRYAAHMVSRMRDFVNNNKFEPNGMIAWY